MNKREEAIYEAYQQNQKTFSDQDRANARKALNIYMSEVHGNGLRSEFDTTTRVTIPVLLQHQSELAQLKDRTQQLSEFIELIQAFEGRPAVQLNLMWYDLTEPRAHIGVLEPEAVPAYRAFHGALVAYFNELSEESPKWFKLADLHRLVSYTVNPPMWRAVGISIPGCSVNRFNTKWFLEAILFKPAT